MKHHTWLPAITIAAIYLGVRLYTGPLAEAVGSTVVLVVGATATLRLAGHGTWSGVAAWLSQHRLTAVAIGVAVAAVVVLGVTHAGRTLPQVLCDALVATAFFLGFAAVYTRLESRWTR